MVEHIMTPKVVLMGQALIPTQQNQEGLCLLTVQCAGVLQACAKQGINWDEGERERGFARYQLHTKEASFDEIDMCILSYSANFTAVALKTTHNLLKLAHTDTLSNGFSH